MSYIFTDYGNWQIMQANRSIKHEMLQDLAGIHFFLVGKDYFPIGHDVWVIWEDVIL